MSCTKSHVVITTGTLFREQLFKSWDRKGADLPQPPSLQWKRLDQHSSQESLWRIQREHELKATIARPRTAQGHQGGAGAGGLYPGGTSNLSNTDFRGVGAATGSTDSGLKPDLALKTFRSETNLKSSLGTMNSSSTSLAIPPRRLGDAGSDMSARPGTAHSMRGLGLRDPVPPLNTSLANMSTSTLGGPPVSPLGQFELESPIRSDTESLLGDEPEKVANEITARIAREEEFARTRTANEERRRVQADLEAQSKRNLQAAGPRTAYPSPPASIEGERDVPALLIPGPKSAFKPPAPYQDMRVPTRGSDTTTRPAGHDPGSRPQQSLIGDERSREMWGVQAPSTEGPLPVVLQASAQDTLESVQTQSGGGERSNENESLSTRTQLLKPQGSREPLRGATVPGASKPQRSPLFQQMSPFDTHSEGEDGENEPFVDHRTANAPYGLPSPPLSHRTRPSDEKEEGLPILRMVAAKRDTTLVGGPGRASLGLQIEEFEKSLQQAQAMSALEQRSLAGIDLRIGTRSRATSNGSSNYSDMSESPLTIEPPLVSPKPFPLSPRPISPGGRLRTAVAEIAPPGRPVLEVHRPQSPLASVKQMTADIQTMRRDALEDRPESPAGGPLRPRVGPAAAPRRPTLDEYGTVKVGTVGALEGRVRRPSPDEYGVQIKRAEPNPLRAASPFRVEVPHDMESPILKDVRHVVTPDYMSYGPASTSTSRANSPILVSTGSGSYSVFSPPQAATVKRPIPPRSINPEWFGPAPTAPPNSPLPIPEKSVRRKNTLELAAQRQQEQSMLKQTPAPTRIQELPGLASSASIVPDTESNPHWPLPGPSSSFSTSPQSEGGFTARRSLFSDKRAPPAPLNIAATKYADEMNLGGNGGPWTSSDTVAPAFAGRLAITPIDRAKTAAGPPRSERVEAPVDSGFDFLKGDPAVLGRGMGPPGQPPTDDMVLDREEDKSSAIGVARGLSIRYDRMREMERRARHGGHERAKRILPAWRLDEEEATTAASPTAVEPFDRLRRPNHGLKSPMGFADEQGTRFI